MSISAFVLERELGFLNQLNGFEGFICHLKGILQLEAKLSNR